MKRITWNRGWQELADVMNTSPEKLGSGPRGQYTELDAKFIMERLNTDEKLQREFLQNLKLKYN